MSDQKRLLTKSAYGYGLVCDRLLWIYQNQRNRLPEPDEIAQAIFDQGHAIGNLAKTLYPDGVEIDWGSGHDAGIAQTGAALAERRPIFEAGFRHGKTHARADILKPSASGRWDLIEVKSSSGVKEEHLDDVAFQKHVYQGAGVRLGRCFVMHVDKTYVRRGALDVSRLFKLTDVTADIKPLAADLPSEIKRQLSIASKPEPPKSEAGPQCGDCGLYRECWSFLPERNVLCLNQAGQKGYDLIYQGILRIKDIPEGYPLSTKQAIQVNCEKTGEPHVERTRIRGFLDRLKYPLHFLDFETFMAGIPPYDELSPYEQIPFQYSLHAVPSPGARVEHYSFLSDGSTDPRPEVLETLKKRLGRAGSVVSYNAPFEIHVLDSCASHFPGQGRWVESIRPRFIDLMAPFRNFHYYHPDQNGSASLKAVLPVLAGRSYEGLEISNGQMAGIRFREMAFGNAGEERKKSIIKALETYCRQDAEGMLEIVKALGSLCR
jgi:hypothetical protein